jgi:hypothetical protein
MRPDTEVPRLRKCPKYFTVGRDLSEHVDIFLRVLSYCSTCNKYLAIDEIVQGTNKPVSRKDTSVKRADLRVAVVYTYSSTLSLRFCTTQCR